MEKKINSREIRKIKNTVSDIQGKGKRCQGFQESTLGRKIGSISPRQKMNIFGWEDNKLK